MQTQIDPVFVQTFEMALKKGDLQRIRIIETAVEVIAEEGLSGGVFEKIAKKLKTRRSHVAYYYNDVDALMLDVVRYVIAAAQKVTVEFISAADSLPDKICAISEGAFEWKEIYPEQAKILLLFYFYASFKPEFRALNQEIRKAGQARLKSLLQNLLEFMGGAVRADSIARDLQVAVTGFILEDLTTATKRGQMRKEAREFCLNYVKTAGLLNAGGARAR